MITAYSTRIFRILIILAAIACATVGIAATPPGSESLWKEGEALVTLVPGTGPERIPSLAPAAGVSSRRLPGLSRLSGREGFLVQSASLSTRQLLDLLGRDPLVAGAWPNYIRRAAAMPNDPSFSDLWGLHNTGQTLSNAVTCTADQDIDAPEGWDIASGTGDVVIAVLDTGVDYTHEDLWGNGANRCNIWINSGEIPGNGIDDDANGYIDDVFGINTVNADRDPLDDNGHGTMVAGTIAALGNNGIGIAGAAWKAKILPLKVLDANGEGTDAGVIEAIGYAVDLKQDHGVNLAAINASWGGYGGGNGDLLWEAIRLAGAAGIAFVASAGNDHVDNDRKPFFPPSYDLPNIIAVAAMDQNGLLADTSNYGAASVDLAAPGANIYSTLPNGGSYVPQATDRFFDNVETANAKWVHGSLNGSSDTWGRSDVDSSSGDWSWADSPSGNYTNGQDTYLRSSQAIDLTDVPWNNWAYLGFRASISLEDQADYLYVEMSGDSGATWKRVDALTGTQGWELHTYLIPPALRTANFTFRFRLVTDGSVTRDGVYLDDIGVGISGGSDGYDFNGDVGVNGTSMAAGYVSGALALLADQYPGDDLTARIDRLLSGVEPLADLSGRVMSGGRLNLYQALYPAQPPRPVITAVTPSAGLVAGARVTVSGRSFGAAAGQVVFAPRFRTAGFRFRFRLQSDRTGRMDGVYIDDVRLGTPAVTYFSDDVESSSANWVGANRSNITPLFAWARTTDDSWSGSYSWTDSPGGNYANNTDSTLTVANPINLAGTAGQSITLEFRASVGTQPEDVLTLEVSDDGSLWVPVLTVSERVEWSRYQVVIPDDAATTPAVVTSWADRSVTAVIPVGAAGSFLRVVRADAAPSLNLATASAWAPVQPSLTAHPDAAVLHYRGRLYVLGGSDASGAASDMVETFTPRLNRWDASTALRLPRPRKGPAAAAAAGRIYVIGGRDRFDEPLAAVDSFDPVFGTWRGEPPLPAALLDAAAAAMGSRVYVAGGNDPLRGTVSDLHVFDAATRSWSALAVMSEARQQAAAIAFGGKLYVFGGADAAGDPLATSEIYDPALGSWSPGPAIPEEPPVLWSAATDGKYIYLAGGGRFLRYDPVLGLWDGAIATLASVAKSGGALAHVPAYGLYLIGGGGTPAPDNEILRLDTRQAFTGISILSPEAGATLWAGKTYPVQWTAPASRASFALSYTLDGGVTWSPYTRRFFGYLYDWKVPRAAGPNKLLKIRLQAYNTAGKAVGKPKLSAFLTLNTVRVTYPDGAEVIHQREVVPIAWTTTAVPAAVARVKLTYSINGGVRWKKLKTVTGNPGGYSWTVPATVASENCRIKVTLLDAGGAVLGSDISDVSFAIRP